MDLLKIVKSKLNNNNIKKTAVELAAAEIETVIKNYCNITKIPVELEYVWANMAVDLLKYQYTADNLENGNSERDGGFDLTGAATSIKVGDTDIKLGTSESAKQTSKILDSHSADLDDIILNYENQLNKFRRIVW